MGVYYEQLMSAYGKRDVNAVNMLQLTADFDAPYAKPVGWFYSESLKEGAAATAISFGSRLTLLSAREEPTNPDYCPDGPPGEGVDRTATAAAGAGAVTAES